jgi:lactate dehydrogenase-like 2-hydroxyacid dehydrogenase
VDLSVCRVCDGVAHLGRHLHLAYDRVRAGNYTLSGLVGFEMAGKTVGVLGTGAIGYYAVRNFLVRACPPLWLRV